MLWSIPHRVSFSTQMGFAASTTSSRDLRRTGDGIFNLAERGREAPEIVNGSGVFHRRHVGAVCVYQWADTAMIASGFPTFSPSFFHVWVKAFLLNRVHRRTVANEK